MISLSGNVLSTPPRGLREGDQRRAGPEGTVVHRPARASSASSEFRPGDRVQYRDVNLWQQGTVAGSDGKWVTVRWDGNAFESREWAPNLRHASTTPAHARKKSPAQLQREVDEALARRHGEARERWLSLQAGPRHRERQAAYDEMAGLSREIEGRRSRPAGATKKRAKEVRYGGYTYNLRSAYDRGYYDALRGAREEERDPDYAIGYAAGLRAPHTRR